MIYSIQKNAAPHIVSGMHFNSARFHELYNWINAVQMDSIAALMRPNGFGLLYVEKATPNFRLELNGEEIQLFKCFAVTENGSLVALSEENEPALVFNCSKLTSLGVYDIMIAVDSENRSPVGMAAAEEIPLRQPFSIPKYQFDVFAQGGKEVRAFPTAIKIGELIKEEQGAKLNEDYIPPCAHVGAHPLMLKKFNEYKLQIEKLKECLIHVSKLTRTKNDPDIFNLHRLSNFGGQFIVASDVVFDSGNKTSTIEFFNFCKSLAKVLLFHFQSLIRQTELSHLIEKNVAHTVGIRFPLNAFREDVTAMASAKYNTNNISESLIIIDRFFSIILTNGFEVLSQNNKIVSIGISGTITDAQPSSKNEEINKPPPTTNNGSFF